MARTCYLHIGAPKCGSTSIQKSFFAAREQLLELGLLYPDGKKARQNFLATLYHADPMSLRFNRDGNLTEEIVVKRARRESDAFRKQAEDNPACDILLSNEVLLGNAPCLDLVSLKKFLLGLADRVVVIAIVRDPVSLLMSRAQEQIKSGARTFEDVVSDPDMHDLRFLDYFEDCFGRDCLRVHGLEAMLQTSGTLSSAFAQLSGLSEQAEDLLQDKKVNSSLSLEAALLVSELNRIAGQGVGRRKRPDGSLALKRGLAAKAFRNIGATRFRLPAKTLDRKGPELLQQYAYLKKKFGITYPLPDFDDREEAAPNWDRDALRGVVELMNDLGNRNRMLRRRVKKARKS